MPASTLDAYASAADLAACRRLLRGGSRTFFAASLLLPRAVRQPASALYAFCRQADDAVDGDGADPSALALLHERLARVYEGCPRDDAADRALADVVERFAVPFALPAALLEGFGWDLQGRRYEDIDALCDYAARVAGTVGAMMAVLMGARSSAVLARACDLGVAMQLSNIARDVGEDARRGRLYLPLAWLREAGIDAERWLAAPRFHAGLAGVIERVLQAADERYATVNAGTAALPVACRPGIRAAHLLYAEIGEEVRRRGHDAVSTRAVVPARRKAWLLARALPAVAMPAPRERVPARRETRFLVEAVAHAPAPRVAAPRAPWARAEARAAWVLDLFERLGQREREALGAATPPGVDR